MPDTRTIRSTTLGLMLVIAGLAILLAILRHGVEALGPWGTPDTEYGDSRARLDPDGEEQAQFRRAFWDGFAIFGWFYLFVAARACTVERRP